MTNTTAVDINNDVPVRLPVDPDTPGGRIRMLRRAFGLTQQALADKVHSTQAAVSMWETNSCMPGMQSQRLLAETLNTTRAFLFEEEAA